MSKYNECNKCGTLVGGRHFDRFDIVITHWERLLPEDKAEDDIYLCTTCYPALKELIRSYVGRPNV